MRDTMVGRASDNKTGQSAVEMIPIFIVIVLLFSIYYVLVAREQVIAYNERGRLLAEQLCSSAAEEINIAALVGDGYSRTFYMPRRMQGYTLYNLTLSKNGLDMTWEGGGDWPGCGILATENATGTINTDAYGGRNSIRNAGEVIYINAGP